MAKMVQVFFNRAENILGKGENAGYQHFLLVQQCFLKVSFPGSIEVVIPNAKYWVLEMKDLGEGLWRKWNER